jgi:ferredoxin
LYDFGFLAGSRNAAQLDLVLSAALGLEPNDVTTVSETMKRGVVADDAELALRDIGEDGIFGRGVPVPTMQWLRRVPRPVLNAIGQSLVLRPEIARDSCTGCEGCFQSCPMGAIAMPEGKAYIDKKKCIQCLCCHELCEYEAVPLKGSPLVELYFSVRDARRKRRAKTEKAAETA